MVVADHLTAGGIQETRAAAFNPGARLGKNQMMRLAFVLTRSLAVLAALVVVAPAGSGAQALSLPLHTRITLSGQTLGSRAGQHMSGHVYATARWNGGARYVVAVPATDSAGHWRIGFRPSHRGDYSLQVLTPDGGLLQYAFVVH